MPKLINQSDYIGKKFFSFTVISFVEKINGRSAVRCICDCGVEKINILAQIKLGKPRSCGCSKEGLRPNLKHGLSDHPIYITWLSMRARCYNEKNPAYKYYGERGITVCDEWRYDFMAFYNWCLQNNWGDDLQLDRKENNFGYNPSNCRFVTPKENSRNRRSNRLIEFNGQTKNLVDWANVFKISAGALSYYLDRYGNEEGLKMVTIKHQKSLFYQL